MMEARSEAPSSLEEGVGGGGSGHQIMRARARAMRNNPTTPEARLWSALRASQLGFKFRRQARIGADRIADFFCPEKGLIVEIDGDTHDRESDLRRDAGIEHDLGFRTIRFTNGDVMSNLDGVLTALGIALRERPVRWSKAKHHPPTPSSEEEGE